VDLGRPEKHAVVARFIFHFHHSVHETKIIFSTLLFLCPPAPEEEQKDASPAR
jgi:hypothetical protein